MVSAVAAHWWVTVALVVLVLGGLIPMLLQVEHYLHRPQRAIVEETFVSFPRAPANAWR
jgi:hypothetical protein